jgi:hypothetical protein
MTDSDQSEDEADWNGPTVSRREIVLAGIGGILTLGIAGGADSQAAEPNPDVSGGSSVSITSATRVDGTDLFVGPDSAKSNVSQKVGKIYLAVDTQIRYYSDGNNWVKLGVGSSTEPAPSVTATDIDADGSFNLPTFSSAQSGLNVGDVIYRTDLD